MMVFFNDPLPTLRAARERLERCDCEQGCPSCIGTVLEVGEPARRDATLLLDYILDGIVG